MSHETVSHHEVEHSPKTPLWLLDRLAMEIATLAGGVPRLVAINGKDASGKTTIADNLARHVAQRTTDPVYRVSLDDYLQVASIRNAPFDDEARGSYEQAFDYQAFVDTFLTPLRSDRSQFVPRTIDLATDEVSWGEPVVVEPDAIMIVDGLFLFREPLNASWDVRILLDADVDTLVARGVARDQYLYGGEEAARDKCVSRFMPSQDIYWQEANPPEKAQIIIDNNNPLVPVVRKHSGGVGGIL